MRKISDNVFEVNRIFADLLNGLKDKESVLRIRDLCLKMREDMQELSGEISVLRFSGPNGKFLHYPTMAEMVKDMHSALDNMHAAGKIDTAALAERKMRVLGWQEDIMHNRPLRDSSFTVERLSLADVIAMMPDKDQEKEELVQSAMKMQA